MTFSLAKTVVECSRKKVKTAVQVDTKLLHKDEDCILEDPSFSQPELLLPVMGWDQEVNKLKASTESLVADIAEMLDEDDAPPLQSEERECYMVNRAYSSPRSLQERDDLSNRKRIMSDTTLSSSDISASHQLIYIAIHKMICIKRIQRPPGIEAVAVSPGPKLADVAPAIFSPGYLEV